jgi:hypothetical protein
VSEDRMMMMTEIDKLDDTFTFRMPEVTKKYVEKLPSDLKKKLNIKLLLSVAEILHEANFDPRKYLSTKD